VLFLSLLCSVLAAETVNYGDGSLEISVLFCLAVLLSRTARVGSSSASQKNPSAFLYGSISHPDSFSNM